MNCIERPVEQARERPRHVALWTLEDGAISFADLFERAARAQRLFRDQGLGPGDGVLVAAPPSAALFAALLAIAGLGACTVLVEPWMSVERIDQVVRLVAPKLFYATFLGRLWGRRVPSIRRIPGWVGPRAAARAGSSGPLHVEQLAPDARASIAFSSGTSGAPRGAVRTHGYLRDLQALLERSEAPGLTGPDLAIFPNVVLFHLGTGRGSVWVPPSWSRRDFASIAELPPDRQPQSLACGPAFLERLLAVPGFASLRSVCVGGALTDCRILEEALARWPRARWTHIYGSTEAEPVALADARVAVAASRARGYFQTLFLGAPIAEIRACLESEGLWVAGPSVCPELLGSTGEGQRRDGGGMLWHFMGDRVEADARGWWYAGRAFQRPEDFQLEQAVYAVLESSACFVHRAHDGHAYLVGEKVAPRAVQLRRRFPHIAGVIEARIVRDRRHRARIDRAATLRRSVPWLAG
ncbi:MAG: AMP-binding protein [Candidatus Rokuibacteriota bacterium]